MIEACGSVCVRLCVSFPCVSVVYLNLASSFFFFLFVSLFAPPLPRYEAFAGFPPLQSRKSRTIASPDTCSSHTPTRRTGVCTHARARIGSIFISGWRSRRRCVGYALNAVFFSYFINIINFFFFFTDIAPGVCLYVWTRVSIQKNR